MNGTIKLLIPKPSGMMFPTLSGTLKPMPIDCVDMHAPIKQVKQERSKNEKQTLNYLVCKLIDQRNKLFNRKNVNQTI